MKSTSVVILLFVSALVAQACGGNEDDGDGGGTRSCPELCSESQIGDCTSITGDCGAFCSALDRAAPKAGCDGDRDDYQSCLSKGVHACDTSCTGPESQLEDCMTAWCIQHSGDADCQVLASSF